MHDGNAQFKDHEYRVAGRFLAVPRTDAPSILRRDTVMLCAVCRVLSVCEMLVNNRDDLM